MCVRIELVAPEPHEVRPCYRGATRMPSTVGTTSESESWLIADVPLDNGFPLEPGAATPKMVKQQVGSRDVVLG